MKVNTNKKNKSASRKLVPAVAMLTTSAVMLSSATYAWFTLNKEVQVTGLTMQATTSDSLEISLGDLSDDGSTITKVDSKVTAPSNADKSWKRTIAISDYYDTIGLLKPASSLDGKNVYYVQNDLVSAGGRVVDDSATVYDATAAYLNIASKYGGNTLSIDSSSSNSNAHTGYYVDIPMWIRTANINSESSDTEVKCEITITDNGGTIAGSELTKAVRVAIIKTNDAVNADKNATDNIATLNVDTTFAGNKVSTALFGLDNSTYNGKVVGKKEPANAPIYSSSIVNAPTSVVTTAENVFTIPSATPDNFAGTSFIARVWIEGESQFCNDATANQDWNIDFKFSILGGNPASGGEGGGT